MPFLDLNVSIFDRWSCLAPTVFYSLSLLNILQASRSVPQFSVNSSKVSVMLLGVIIMVPHFAGGVLPS